MKFSMAEGLALRSTLSQNISKSNHQKTHINKTETTPGITIMLYPIRQIIPNNTFHCKVNFQIINIKIIPRKKNGVISIGKHKWVAVLNKHLQPNRL